MSLAGCAGPAAPGTTTLSLSGKVGPLDGLLKFPLTGSVTGAPIVAGVTATVTANLVVNVSLSGNP